MAAESAHAACARNLRSRLESTEGATSQELRAGAGRVAAGEAGAHLPDPYDRLVKQIASAAYRVTDEDVAAVRAAVGSEKAAFEIVMSACVGAGLNRWDAARRAIEESGDASA